MADQPIQPLPPGYPPPFSLPVDTAGGGVNLGGAENQVHLAWARLTLAVAHRLPVGLNKMTFYRARLKRVVS